MSVPFSNHVFDTADPEGSTLQLLRLLFPGRETIGAELSIQALAKGTTNALFKVSRGAMSTAPQDCVLIKVYGEGTNITIDREKELRVHKLLADRQLCSPPLVRFANGHAYQFTRGAVCTGDLISHTKVFLGVAKEVARWHATLPTLDLRDPLRVLAYEPGVWSTARNWINAISKHPGRSKTEIDSLLEKLQYLIAKLLLTGNVPESLVLGHGDLLCDNIIVQDHGDGLEQPEVRGVRFIDYEHATYCPVAFELANHFAEWAGFDCNYNQLPKTSVRRAFIREYLQTHSDISRNRDGAHLPSVTKSSTVTDAAVESLVSQVDDFRGFPGFYWGLCALIQAETSTGAIDFDYTAYARKRFAEYEAWRKVYDGGLDPDEEIPPREKIWAMP